MIAFYEEVDFEFDGSQEEKDTENNADKADLICDKKKDFETLLIDDF